MSLFYTLLLKLVPLYATMGVGAFLARRTGNLTTGLAVIQIYFMTPVIIFANSLKLTLSPGLFLLPIMFLVLACLTSLMGKGLGLWLKSPQAPLLAQASGTANIGYFGLPVAAMLLPPEGVAVYLFTLIGGNVYEATLGYYWIARGAFSPKETVKKLAHLPLLYALACGLILNACHVRLPVFWEAATRDFMGAYVVLGALIVGFALAKNKRMKIHPQFLGALLTMKWLVWPGLTWLLVMGLRGTAMALPAYGEQTLLLMSIMPVAANVAAFASLLNVHPDDAAAAIAISTLLSLAVVPGFILLWGLGV